MPPLRRYLRLTKRTVLETRIYLDNPLEEKRWLLRANDPALVRVIEAVRPLVLPKLKEESQRSHIRWDGHGNVKGKKPKMGIKDVIYQEDFEVSIYLTDMSRRHSILTRRKVFDHHTQKLKSNSSKLTGAQNDVPIEIDDAEVRGLYDIPQHEETGEDNEQDAAPTNEALSMSDTEDKKESFRTEYSGFAIYGRILCLVIKRKDPKNNTAPSKNPAKKRSRSGTPITPAVGQNVMEDWIQNTQVNKELAGA